LATAENKDVQRIQLNQSASPLISMTRTRE